MAIDMVGARAQALNSSPDDPILTQILEAVEDIRTAATAPKGSSSFAASVMAINSVAVKVMQVGTLSVGNLPGVGAPKTATLAPPTTPGQAAPPMALPAAAMAMNAVAVKTMYVEAMHIGTQSGGRGSQGPHGTPKPKQDKKESLLDRANKAVAPAAGVFGQVLGLMGQDNAAVQTFMGSIKLLTTEIGNLFIPALQQVSMYIQDVYRWIAGLDEGTKSNIRYWVGWGVAIISTAAAIKVVIAVLSPLVTILLAVRGAMMTLWAVSLAHPFLAIATAVAVVAVAFLGMSSSMSRATESVIQHLAQLRKMEELIERLRKGGPVTYEDFQGNQFTPEERRRILDTEGKPEERRRVLTEMRNDYGNRRLQQEVPADPKEADKKEQEILRASEIVRRGLLNAQDLRGRGTYAEQRREKVEESFRDAGYDGRQAREMTERHYLGGGNSGSNKERLSEDEINNLSNSRLTQFREQQARRRILDQALAQNGQVPITQSQRDGAAHGEKRDAKGNLLRAIPKEMQPQFSAFEQARKNIQVASLEGDPLQREQLQLQRQGNMQAERSAQTVESIRDMLNNWAQRFGLRQNNG